MMNWQISHHRTAITFQILCAVAVCAAVQALPARAAAAVNAAREKAPALVASTPQSLVARMVSAKGSDYERMPQVLGLEGKALEQYQAALKKRNEAYEKWEKSAQGQKYVEARKQFTSARRGRDGRMSTEARKSYDTLRAEQEKLRRDLRKEFNRQFTPGQLRLWSGDMLYTAVIAHFDPAQLDENQKQQATAICCVLGATVNESAKDQDPYFEPTGKMKDRAIEEIRMLVLRADQRGKVRG
jgi:hypothetical protein